MSIHVLARGSSHGESKSSLHGARDIEQSLGLILHLKMVRKLRRPRYLIRPVSFCPPVRSKDNDECCDGVRERRRMGIGSAITVLPFFVPLVYEYEYEYE